MRPGDFTDRQTPHVYSGNKYCMDTHLPWITVTRRGGWCAASPLLSLRALWRTAHSTGSSVSFCRGLFKRRQALKSEVLDFPLVKASLSVAASPKPALIKDDRTLLCKSLIFFSLCSSYSVSTATVDITWALCLEGKL
jgi:hypothetical protein